MLEPTTFSACLFGADILIGNMMPDYTAFICCLTDAPDAQLDAHGVELVKQWSNPPSPAQILELLDKCICYAWSSGFVVTLLKTVLNTRIEEENTTYDAVAAQATWRATLLD